MTQEREQAKLKFWPTPQDYNEAVQAPTLNFTDPELQAGEVATDARGIPKPISGGFASVYRVHSPNQDWAIRCFLRDIPDCRSRYAKISEFVEHDTLPYTVGFNYQQRGIKIANQWFPLLKMDWVDGLTLDNYLNSAIKRGSIPESLADRFKQMTLDLQAVGIAHGDLQHGNIMIQNEQLYLVDYDGMYVPAMNGLLSNELGHRNYQHPRRTARDFGPFLDNFSSWVIYTSLKALSIDPTLYEQLGSGDDCLLFRHADFTDPLNSCAFNVLENHENGELRLLGRFIRKQLECAPRDVPGLDAPIEVADGGLLPLNADAPTRRHEKILISVEVGEPAPVSEAEPSPLSEAEPSHPAPANIPYPELLKPSPREIEGKSEFSNSVLGAMLLAILVGWLVITAFSILFSPHNPPLLTVALLGVICFFLYQVFALPAEILRQRMLVRDGVPVTGELISVTPIYGRTGTVYCNIKYSYTANGMARTAKMNGYAKFMQNHHTGDKITVLYHPTDSQDSIVYEAAEYKAMP